MPTAVILKFSLRNCFVEMKINCNLFLKMFKFLKVAKYIVEDKKQ